MGKVNVGFGLDKVKAVVSKQIYLSRTSRDELTIFCHHIPVSCGAPPRGDLVHIIQEDVTATPPQGQGRWPP